jgi:protein phosphatase
VLCGPAACGKTTFAQKHFRPTQVISSDWARALICDDERDQRYNSQAFALVHFLVEQRLAVNRLCVVDSTALAAPARNDLLALAKRHQVPTTAILFNVPLATCLARDEERERSVGAAVIERQYEAFAEAKAAIGQEGFGQVTELEEADLDHVRIEVLFRPVMRSAPNPHRTPRPGQRPFERSPRPAGSRPSGQQNGVRSATPPTGPRADPPANDAPRAIPPAPTVATVPRVAATAAPVGQPQPVPAVPAALVATPKPSGPRAPVAASVGTATGSPGTASTALNPKGES